MAGRSRPKDGVASARLNPAIHVFAPSIYLKTWMPGTRPGMTELNEWGDYSPLPNSAAKRFSPVRLKLTTRLPGAESRTAHFSSVKRFMTAAPSVPAR